MLDRLYPEWKNYERDSADYWRARTADTVWGEIRALHLRLGLCEAHVILCFSLSFTHRLDPQYRL